MKREYSIGGHVVVIEAEGAVSVSVREAKETPEEEAPSPDYACPMRYICAVPRVRD